MRYLRLQLPVSTRWICRSEYALCCAFQGNGQKQTLLQQLAEDSDDDDDGTDAFSDAGSLGGWDEEEEEISPEDQRALAAFMVSHLLSNPLPPSSSAAA